MSWTLFIYFAVASALLWSVGAVLSVKRRKWAAAWTFVAGCIVFAAFIVAKWVADGHAPMRTMGETRLLYSLFIATVGLAVYLKQPYRFVLPYSALTATVFAIINIAKPELHTAPLMPALRSAWFVPHVAVYISAYAVLTMAVVAAVAAFVRRAHRTEYLAAADNLTRVGSAMVLIAMCMGAVWAKQAWGNYWAWDPKECWAAATWLLLVLYLHIRFRWPNAAKVSVTVLIVAFLCLQVTWYGLNFMPSAEKSMHTYAVTK